MPIERHQASGLFPPLTLPSFDDAPPAPKGPAAAGTAGSTAEQPPGLPLPTAAEIEAVWESARQEGYAEGFAAGKTEGYAEGFAAGKAEGYAAGFAEGKAAGEAAGREAGFAAGYEAGRTEGEAAAHAEWEPKWAEQVAALQALVAGLGKETETLPQRLAEPVATLALAIARAVVGSELAARPEAVAAVAEAALREAASRPVVLRIHPEDQALIEQALGATDGVTWAADATLPRGSVIVEGESFLIDATLPSRWRRIVSRLYPKAATWSCDDESSARV